MDTSTTRPRLLGAAALLCLLVVPIAAAALVLLAVPPAGADARSKPVWLCKPGIEDNPCEPGLKTTQLSHPGQELGVKNVKRAKRRRIDCFYVYPTVSDQPTPQANLDIDPELRSVARATAARFSRDCRVYAPVYREITIAGLLQGSTEEMGETAYSDVLRAWKTYLRKHNRGRGVVLIGTRREPSSCASSSPRRSIPSAPRAAGSSPRCCSAAT